MATTDKSICLVTSKGRRAILAGGLWFLAVWFLIWPVAWVAITLVTGEGLWRFAVAPLLWLLVPWFVTRVIHQGTILLAPQTICRVGFFKDHRMAWSEITGLRHYEQRYGSRGMRGMVAMVAVQAKDRELILCPSLTKDPKGHLTWAFERALAGEVTQITDRVQAEGHSIHRLGWYLPHFLTALVLSLGIGYLIFGSQQSRHGERLLRGVERASYEEKLEVASAIAGDDKYSQRLRCRAERMLVSAEIRENHLEKAMAACETMMNLSCSNLAYKATDCSPFKSLLAAKNATTPEQVLKELDSFSPLYPPAIMYSMEISALRELQRNGEADALAEACMARFSDSKHAVTQTVTQACIPSNAKAAQ